MLCDKMFESQDQICALLWLLVAVISIIPLVAFTVAYKRVKKAKLLITLIAFGIFLVKGVVIGMKIFIPTYSDEFWWSVAAILDILIIGLITLSIITKK